MYSSVFDNMTLTAIEKKVLSESVHKVEGIISKMHLSSSFWEQNTKHKRDVFRELKYIRELLKA